MKSEFNLREYLANNKLTMAALAIVVLIVYWNQGNIIQIQREMQFDQNYLVQTLRETADNQRDLTAAIALMQATTLLSQAEAQKKGGDPDQFVYSLAGDFIALKSLSEQEIVACGPFFKSEKDPHTISFRIEQFGDVPQTPAEEASKSDPKGFMATTTFIVSGVPFAREEDPGTTSGKPSLLGVKQDGDGSPTEILVAMSDTDWDQAKCLHPDPGPKPDAEVKKE
jgi:hypothetical protein